MADERHQLAMTLSQQIAMKTGQDDAILYVSRPGGPVRYVFRDGTAELGIAAAYRRVAQEAREAGIDPGEPFAWSTEEKSA